MIRKIIQIGDKKLLTKSDSVKKKELVSKDVQNLIDDLLDTVEHYKEEAAGLSAVQIGILKRIFVVKDMREKGNGEWIVCVNPTMNIIDKNLSSEWEGCMSINKNNLKLFGPVDRPREVSLDYLDREGNEQKLAANGFFSHLVQHEMDHLNGKLFLGYIKNPKNIWREDELDDYIERTGHLPTIKE